MPTPLIQIEDTALCNNRLEVKTPGGVELRALQCKLPKDHQGVHSNGSACWANTHRTLSNLMQGKERDA